MFRKLLALETNAIRAQIDNPRGRAETAEAGLLREPGVINRDVAAPGIWTLRAPV